MKTLLTIQASLFGDQGVSSRLVRQFGDNWLRHQSDGRVITRDLSKNPVPHLDAARFTALTRAEVERSPEEQAIADHSDALIEELREADALALGVPMYNLDVPSTLRAYFDHIARAGITFKYTDKGPVGLLDDKPTCIFLTRGGQYGDSHSQTRFLQQFFGLIGISNIEFVHVEGLNMGDAAREQALRSANDTIADLLPSLQRASGF